ncbi:coniferyl aldehyde dehydrogenase [Vibrio sp. SG41-7]|uniref:coniferyl aldehyde dehydrogenase n=1 Tax=Vibrio sp. SG41-7 TaxID=2760973 RepID=UPI0015FF245B|nr:coniferyl aldehyde dehydrogenase [Vibrio sp. SG41-7]MBB1466470.1 coniferyl aldehyde dehydrogenase [Vibrio sp. SG41-7]
MNHNPITNDESTVSVDMNATFSAQQARFRSNSNPDIKSRQEDLARLKTLLVRYQDQLIEALSEDYGQRAKYDSLISDITPSLHLIDYNRKHLKKWMKPSRRGAGLMLQPAKVRVHYQPLGVIGIIVPWNFPIMLSIGPLATALAAGNTAMMKMSEFTPATNRVLKKMLSEGFSEDQISIIEGEADIAAQFSALPFDHIMFTGSTAVGKHVMKAASANLTPVTLELGGKSPTVIAPDMDIMDAVQRTLFSKSLNAGQICVAPDYILLPKAKVNEFVDAYKSYFKTLYPAGLESKDLTSVINLRQYTRLKSVIEDAEQKGATIHTVSEQAQDDVNHRMTPHLLTEVNDDMLALQEELFGPILPIVPYDSLDEAIDYINDRPRPLALYIMSHDNEVQEKLLSKTHSGGVCINDSLVHVAVDDAPFGGIGPSGMGHYHGIEGFKTFSHAKTVLSRGKINYTKLLHPPYNSVFKKLIFKVINR